jgi:acyl-CoA reductase-like NAD-dependent aldehyde dehydrogenase
VIPAKQTLTMGRLYAAMIAGAVWINVSVPFIVQMSNGGFKHSGYGMDMPMYRF